MSTYFSEERILVWNLLDYQYARVVSARKWRKKLCAEWMRNAIQWNHLKDGDMYGGTLDLKLKLVALRDLIQTNLH